MGSWKPQRLRLTFTERTINPFFKSRTMTRLSTRAPAALQDKCNAIAHISQATDAFCNQRLNHGHRQLICLAKVGA